MGSTLTRGEGLAKKIGKLPSVFSTNALDCGEPGHGFPPGIMMLHFAQITVDRQENRCQLLVLASCHSHQCWQKNSLILPLTEGNGWAEGMLVLVETDEDNKVHQMKDGLDWLLEILEILPEVSGSALGKPLSSLVKQEKRRVEGWRQEMAAKNLELTRQQIELEAQRQQLKELELKLNQTRVTP